MDYMRGLITITVRLIRAGERAYTRKWNFLGLFAFVFFGSVIMLAQFDLLPSSPKVIASVPSVAATNINVSTLITPELPTKIEIQAIGLSATITNPTTIDVAILDEGLLKGAVRYPTSAKLGEAGNVVLFGHSSYLPIVGNQAYKTFNGIQKLVVGDVVTVSSSGTAYTYRVKSVTKESANDAVIPLSVAGKVLTLSTCNSFAEKTDRFVVVADFVESHSVST
jgi:LPXTG-site transpeptidase (sortase) family protein